MLLTSKIGWVFLFLLYAMSLCFFTSITLILTAVIFVLLEAQLFLRYLLKGDKVHFTVRQDVRYTLHADEVHPVILQHDGFLWPTQEINWDTAVLKLKFKANFLGQIQDPYLLVTYDGLTFRHYFERACNGIRYINLSELQQKKLPQNAKIHLSSKHLTWKSSEAELLLFTNKLDLKDSTLILSPHPDDAEIAAFHFYKQTKANVVCITAGEIGSHHYLEAGAEREKQATLRGRLRSWDSIAVPLWAGIMPSQAVNLGYFDVTLEDMARQPEKTIPSTVAPTASMQQFRSQHTSPLLRETQASNCWLSLIADLDHIITTTQPRIIVAPHPLLDGHADHRYTTLALLQVLSKHPELQGSLLLYSNHHPLADSFPFGAPHSPTGIPPWFDESSYFERIYSHTVNEEERLDKIFALEATHDLRAYPSYKKWKKHKLFWQNVVNLVRGRRYPSYGYFYAQNYFRKAVRSNELFFTYSYSAVEKLQREWLSKVKPLRL